MSRLSDPQDAYGHLVFDGYEGADVQEIVERDDGYIAVSRGPAAYLAEYPDWPLIEKQAVRLARGRVLDVGCGAGRVALHLQQKGLDAVGIDISPLAIEVCKLRGLRDARVLPITQVSRRLGVFDTIVMYGNNFGLMGGPRRARWLLRRFHGMTSPRARIIGECRDPYATTDPDNLDYHERNRRRGRMGGQLRIRVRYGRRRTPWFDYLFVSPDEMRELLDGSGWSLQRLFEGAGGVYVAVIEKTPPQSASGD
jgi:SAM-dependent methyltransferase